MFTPSGLPTASNVLTERKRQFVQSLPDVSAGKLSLSQAALNAGFRKPHSLFSVKDGTVKTNSTLYRGMNESERETFQRAVSHLNQEFVNSGLDFNSWNSRHTWAVNRQTQGSSSNPDAQQQQQSNVPADFGASHPYSQADAAHSSFAGSGSQSFGGAIVSVPTSPPVIAPPASTLPPLPGPSDQPRAQSRRRAASKSAGRSRGAEADLSSHERSTSRPRRTTDWSNRASQLSGLIPGLVSHTTTIGEASADLGMHRDLGQIISIKEGRIKDHPLITALNEADRRILDNFVTREHQEFKDSGHTNYSNFVKARRAAQRTTSPPPATTGEQKDKFVQALSDVRSGKLTLIGAARAAGVSDRTHRLCSIKDGVVYTDSDLYKNMNESDKKSFWDTVSHLHQDYVNSGLTFEAWRGRRAGRSSYRKNDASSSNAEEQRFIVPPGLEFEDLIDDEPSRHAGGPVAAGEPSRQTDSTYGATPGSLSGLTPLLHGARSSGTVAATTSQTPLDERERRFDLINEGMKRGDDLRSLDDLKDYLYDVPSEVVEQLVRHRNGVFEWTPDGERYARRLGRETNIPRNDPLINRPTSAILEYQVIPSLRRITLRDKDEATKK
jgi:hypothetical protein